MTTTSRTDFNETWLTEMPRRAEPIDLYGSIVSAVKDRIQGNMPVTKLNNNLNKLIGNHTIVYWYGNQENIILGVELDIKYQGLVVNIVGKNPKYTNQPPYASDLYTAILNDTHRPIRLFSDSSLSDEGLKIWKRLVQLGNSVSVYNRENPGQTFKTFDSPEELDQFFSGTDASFSKYQFMISEVGPTLAETRSFFNLRRVRELSGLGTED